MVNKLISSRDLLCPLFNREHELSMEGAPVGHVCRSLLTLTPGVADAVEHVVGASQTLRVTLLIATTGGRPLVF